jgi:hypothetical protein
MMKRFESQKIRDSEPRRTLIRSSYPDVQWRRLSKEDRLRERGFHHKVYKAVSHLSLRAGWEELSSMKNLERKWGETTKIYPKLSAKSGQP